MIQAGARHVPNIQKTMKNVLAKWKGLKIDYLAVCDARSLEPLTKAKGNMVLVAAVRLGHVRLIDNMLVKV